MSRSPRTSSAGAGAPRADPLYGLRAFELARSAVEIGTGDAQTLARRAATRLVSGQLLRSVGSITANIAEGYGRGTGADRARFYEYALGSAREAREWYRSAGAVLQAGLVSDRLARLDAIVSLLIGLVRETRTRTIRRDALRARTER
jgi:four helix bundle protein